MNERMDLLEVSEYFTGNERKYLCNIVMNGTLEQVETALHEADEKMSGRKYAVTK